MKLTRKHLALLLLVILGIGAIAQENQPEVAFYVNEIPVLKDAMYRTADEMALKFMMNNLNPFYAESVSITSHILLAAVEEDCDGVVVSDEQIEEFINNFRNTRGLVTKNDYELFLSFQGFTTETFRNAVTNQMQVKGRIDEIKQSVTVDEQELEFYYVNFSDLFDEKHLFQDLKPSQREYIVEEATQLKQSSVIEDWIQALRSTAVLRSPNGTEATFYNPPVADVDGTPILLGEFAQYLLDTKLRSGWLDTKPKDQKFEIRTLRHLMDVMVVSRFVRDSGMPYIGTSENNFEVVKKNQIKNVVVTQEDTRKHYLQNIATYQTNSTALLTKVSFKKESEAELFRVDLVRSQGINFAGLTKKYNALAVGKPARFSGNTQQHEEFFLTKRLSPIGKNYITKVMSEGKLANVYLISELRNNIAVPFEKIQEKLQAEVLLSKREKVFEAWLAGQRKRWVSGIYLDAVNKELAARMAKLGK